MQIHQMSGLKDKHMCYRANQKDWKDTEKVNDEQQWKLEQSKGIKWIK